MGKIFLYALGVGAVLIGLGVAFSWMNSAAKVATAPARVISKTLETDNIISNYEFFHDAWNSIQARVNQKNSHKGFLALENDPAEKTRLRIELAAIQQSCRDLVAKYNANATKTNRSIFMGREAPAAIDPSSCE